MSNVQGKISSSLDVAMQDVTMSFRAVPSFYSSSIIAYDISSPYVVDITLPPTQENDIMIVSVAVGASSANIWCTDCTSIGKTTSTGLISEWFWKRLTGSQATQQISSSANNLYGVASIWRGCVTSSTPYLEPPVSTSGYGAGIDPIASSVTANEENTTLVCFVNIEDDTAIGRFPPENWSENFNQETAQGTDARLLSITQDESPTSGSGTEQVYTCTTGNQTDYWATLTLLLKNSSEFSETQSYTDSNGNFTQSFAGNWSGKLLPTYEGYSFFDGLTIKDGIMINISSSDITQDLVGVKDPISGSGWPENPFIITDGEQFHNIRYRRGVDVAGGGYYAWKFGSDIDLSSFDYFPMIAPNYTLFATIDGDNYTLRNAKVTSQSIVEPPGLGAHYVGIIGVLDSLYSDTSISNITLESCSVDLGTWAPNAGSIDFYHGMIIGRQVNISVNYVNIHIKNCYCNWEPTMKGHQGSYQFSFISPYNNTGNTNYIYSCSVEDSNYHFHNYTSASGWSFANGMYHGALAANSKADQYIRFCLVKNTTQSVWMHSGTSNYGYGGATMAGGSQTWIRDSYALNNLTEVNSDGASTSKTASAFIRGTRNAGGTTRNYVAKYNFGFTDQDATVPFAMDYSGSENYYESGTTYYGYQKYNNASPLTTQQMKNIENYGDSWYWVGVWDSDNIASIPESIPFGKIANASESVSYINYRNIITGSLVDNDYGYIRVKFINSGSINWYLSAASVMNRVGQTISGSNPTSLLWNGSATYGLVTPGSEVWSDLLRYEIPTGQDFMIHIRETAPPSGHVPIFHGEGTLCYRKFDTGNETLNENWDAGVPEETSSYCFDTVELYRIVTSSSGGGIISGLTTHYDSRISYVSATNIWSDLISHGTTLTVNSGYPYLLWESVGDTGSETGTDATTVNTYPTNGHLYFGTEYGASSASFTGLLVSRSFAVEFWIAPTTQSSKMYLFSTTSGSYPRIEGYISQSYTYFGYQSSSADSVSYLSSSALLNTNKFNHIAYQIAPFYRNLWVNGSFQPSASLMTVSDGGWSGGTIGVLNTEQTNPYYGYIDVVKIWNGPAMPTEKDDSDDYYIDRNYFPDLPTVTFPSPADNYFVKIEDNDAQGIYTGSTFTYGELDVDVFIPSASNPNSNRYIAMYWLVQTNDDIGTFYPDAGTLAQETYEIIVYQPDSSTSPTAIMGARKTYPGSPWEYDFFITPTKVFTYDRWTTLSIKRNSIENEYFTGSANQIAQYIDGVLFQTGSAQMGNPSDGTDSPCADSLIYSSSKYMIMQTFSSGSKIKNLRINGLLQDLSGWTQLPSDKYEYVLI